MTIGNQVSSVVAQGNGVTTSWTFQFLIPTTASCVVQILDTTVDPETVETLASVDFSVSGVGVTSGGVVTYPLSGTPLTSGQYLTIYRVLPLTQTSSIANAGNLYPTVIENALDYRMMVAQQLQTAIDAVEAQLDDPTPGIVESTAGEFTTVVADTATFGTLTATTASIGTMIFDGAQFDTSITVRSVTSGQTVTLSSTSSFTPLTLTQSAAALTVHLPPSPTDGQISGFSFDQNITALTVSGNGSTLKNAPVTTSAWASGSVFGWVYDSTAAAWFRDEGAALPGSTLTFLTASATINFGTIVTANSATSSVTVTGTVFGDFVQVSPASSISGCFLGALAGTGVVTVFCVNLTGGTVTVASQVFYVEVLQKASVGL